MGPKYTQHYRSNTDMESEKQPYTLYGQGCKFRIQEETKKDRVKAIRL